MKHLTEDNKIEKKLSENDIYFLINKSCITEFYMVKIEERYSEIVYDISRFGRIHFFTKILKTRSAIPGNYHTILIK